MDHVYKKKKEVLNMAGTDFKRSKITELREKLGMTQYEFAKQIGTSRQRVHQWEEGICMPQVEAISKICKAFNVAPEYFFA
jgi:transcriptional regulator with XRE-family HTH domain